MCSFDSHFLFSETYIKELIKDKGRIATYKVELSNAFRQMKDLYHEYTVGDFASDPWPDYIDTALDYLGFQKRVEGSSRILFSDTIKDDSRPVAVCYIIDKSENIASTIKGKYYAFDTIKEARKYNTNWAILTDGNRWRLYNTNNISPYENYIEINIEESIKNDKDADEAFRLFYLFLNVKTYYLEDNDLVIEKIKDESDTKAEIIEDTLRGKAEEILKELCYGLKEDIHKESFSEEEKKAIYDDAIILLYRMLFFGYAESRGLLPIVVDDPDYTDSFKKICEDAKNIHNDGKVLDIKDGFEFWNRLDEHIRLYVDRSYNGGLFHNDDKPILKEHRISNGRLTKCLAELSYNLDRNGKYTEVIEYKDLSVRNLGSIYEGLLEYRLFIAEERIVQRKSKGQVKYYRESEVKLQTSDIKNIIEKGGIYLSQDALERKETGAYYTPEDVVEYIVNNTVGKKINELKDELSHKIDELKRQLSYEPVESRKRIIQRQIDELTMSFISEKILSLSIIDSAMGSGHFLVNAAYRVANEIVEIISNNNWASDDEIIVDIRHWKRKVVENCIYGIDINSLSVALARLSLWLISASNDKALSFIDHHLKEGNSIIGTDRRHVEIKDSKYPLFGVSYEEYMRPILNKYKELSAIGSATKLDVIKQKEIYDEINKELELAKKKYDYYLASQYVGGIADQVKYMNLLRSTNIVDFQESRMSYVNKHAEEYKFFHWELEFPEVFNRGGFDIAIGNPPYVDVSPEIFRYSISRVVNTRNLYPYMIETCIRYLKLHGYFGYILPLSSICTDRMFELQSLFDKEKTYLHIANFGRRPSRIFKEADIATTIIYGNKNGQEYKAHSTKYVKFYKNERKNLFNSLRFAEVTPSIINGSIPKFDNYLANNIVKKILSNEKGISSYFEKKQSESYIIYKRASDRYYNTTLNFVPTYLKNGKNILSSTSIMKYFKDNETRDIVCAVFNSNLFYWFYMSYSDCYDLVAREIDMFRFDIEKLNNHEKERLVQLCSKLMDDYRIKSRTNTINYAAGTVEQQQFYPKYSKWIIDEIDDLLAEFYGFSKDELEFIKNYDMRFRVSEESIEEED